MTDPRARAPRPCGFPLCDRPHRANGWCNAHNEQARRGKELTPLLALPKYALTYVAYWRDVFGLGEGVLKVGRAWKWSRIVELQSSGAHVIVAHPGTDSSWEREALAEMSRLFDPAFTSGVDAADILCRGRGWTECFRVSEHDLHMAFRMCIRAFARGNEEGANPDDGIRPKWNREQWLRYKLKQVANYLAESGAGSHTDGPVDDGGHQRPYAARRDADRIDAVPAPARADSRPRPDRNAPPCARGDRLPRPTTRRQRLVARPAPARLAHPGTCHPKPPSAPYEPAILHGYRERARGNAHAGESARGREGRCTVSGMGSDGGRGSGGRGSLAGLGPASPGCTIVSPRASPPAQCSPSGLRRASAWSGVRHLRSLRISRPVSRGLAHTGTLWREARALRGGTVS